MGLFSKTPSGRVRSIESAENWTEIKSGIRWSFEDETDHGVKLRKKYCREMKNMNNGETEILVRDDAEVEWYEHDEEWSWPPYVHRAIEEGHTWKKHDESAPPMGYTLDFQNWSVEK